MEDRGAGVMTNVPKLMRYRGTMIMMLHNQNPETQQTMKMHFLQSEKTIPQC